MPKYSEMEKCTYITVILCLLIQSCTDDSYVGTGEELMGVTEPIPVTVSIGDPAGNIIPGQNVAVKGNGTIDKVESLTGKNIYVYAFSRRSGASYSVTSASNEDVCLVDASKDVPGSLYGKEANIIGSDAYVNWTGDEKVQPFWLSGDKYTSAYDFFAYYIDDIQPRNIRRDDNSVSFDIEIDGKQDVMSSKAELTDVQLSGLSDSDRISVEAYAFSYYTAQRSIDPIFQLKHHLVKLTFELVPGLLAGINKVITAKEIRVLSQKHATFTVADKEGDIGLVFNDDVDAIKRTEDDDGQKKVGAGYSYALVHAPLVTPDQENPEGVISFRTRRFQSEAEVSHHVDGSILVAPVRGTYRAYLELKEDVLDDEGNVLQAGEFKPLLFEIPFSVDGREEDFLLGNQYHVRLKVFGESNISVEVELMPWEYVGYIDVNMDNPDKYGK